MHWIALPWPWCDEPSGPVGGTVKAAAAGWWALRFTPRVALVDGEAVLLEVSTTERLWGGRDALLAQVQRAWAEAFAACVDATVPPPGAQAAWGTGPTALVAQAWLRMALAGHSDRLLQRIETLPLQPFQFPVTGLPERFDALVNSLELGKPPRGSGGGSAHGGGRRPKHLH